MDVSTYSLTPCVFFVVRNVGHCHNCTYSNMSDRLYRITAVNPGNYWLAGDVELMRDLARQCAARDPGLTEADYLRLFQCLFS